MSRRLTEFSRSPKAMLACAAACAVVFGVLLTMVHVQPGRWLDAAALEGFISLDDPPQNAFTTPIAHIGDPIPVLLVTAALMLAALAQGRPRSALAAFVIVGGANVTTQILKPLLAFPRDGSDLVGTQIVGPAFPSGHTTASMAIALAAVIVAPRALRAFVAAVVVLLAIAVPFAIVSLGWHYPSDVIGGYLVATGWAFLALAGLRYADARWPSRAGRDAAAAAARRAVERGRPAVSTPVAVVIGGVALVVLLVIAALVRSNFEQLVDFAARHTVFAVAAPAIVVAAIALLAGITLVTTRR